MAFRCLLSGINCRSPQSSVAISRSAAPRSVAAAVTAAAAVGLSSPTTSEGSACRTKTTRTSDVTPPTPAASDCTGSAGGGRLAASIVYPLPAVATARTASIVAVNKLQKSPVSNQRLATAGGNGSASTLEQRKQLQQQQQQQQQQLRRSSNSPLQQHRQKFVVVAAARGDPCRGVGVDNKLNGLRRVVCSTSQRRLPGGGQAGGQGRVVPPNATGGEPLEGAASSARQATHAAGSELPPQSGQQQVVAPPQPPPQQPSTADGDAAAGRVVTGSVIAMGSVTASACLRVPMSGPAREKTRLSASSDQQSNGLLRLAAGHHHSAANNNNNNNSGGGVVQLIGGGAPTAQGVATAVTTTAGGAAIGVSTGIGRTGVLTTGTPQTGAFSLGVTSQGAVLSNGLIAKKVTSPAVVSSKAVQLVNGSSTTNRSSCTSTTITTSALPSSIVLPAAAAAAAGQIGYTAASTASLVTDAATPAIASTLATTYVTSSSTTVTNTSGRVGLTQTSLAKISVNRSAGTPADTTVQTGPTAVAGTASHPELSRHSSTSSSSLSIPTTTQLLGVSVTTSPAVTSTKSSTGVASNRRPIATADSSLVAVRSSSVASSTASPTVPLTASCWKSSAVRTVVTTGPVSTNGGLPLTVMGNSRLVESNATRTVMAGSIAGGSATSRLDQRIGSKSTDDAAGVASPAGPSGASGDETDRRVTEECAALQRRLDQLRRRHHQLSQRVHRVQAKSGVEVAYSELKEVVARGQEIFRMPCLMSRSGQLAAQMAQKEEKAGTSVPRHLSEQDRLRVTRRCGIHSAVISTSEKLCDSSATESSSEEEDMPTKMDFFNGKQKLTPFRYATRDASVAPRHPAWRWAAQRAAMGARWTWLQAQVSELEYRIRQQHELCRQLRASKQPCLQYSPQHPPTDPNSTRSNSPSQLLSATEGQCARSVPLSDNFRKRRLVLAQRISSQAAESVPMDALQPSCDCAAFYPRLELCARCSLLHAQSRRERLELCEEQRSVQLHSGLSSAAGGAGGSHGPHHVALASAAAAHEAQLARQLLSSPSGERQSEGARLACYDEPFHGVLSGKEDVSLAMHYESLLRAGYSSVLYKNAYAPNHPAAAAAAAGGTETISDSTAGKRKDSSKEEGSGSAGAGQSSAGTAGKNDDSLPSAPKRKRHSSHAASRANKNERKSTGGGGSNSRPTAAEAPVSKKRRSDRGRLASLASAARRSNSVDSQELADEETITDANTERNNYHLSRPRKTSYVNQQESSYDIDNIIPYGMSCTRLVERLKYKEILTPKWRLVHILPEVPTPMKSKKDDVASSSGDRPSGTTGSAESVKLNPLKSGSDKEDTEGRAKERDAGVESGELVCDGGGVDSDIEDISDFALQARHARQEALERERFSAYLKPKMSHQSGLSAGGVSAGANSRRSRTDSSNENNASGLSLRSKESGGGSSSKAKDSEELDRGPLTPAAGGKAKEDSVSHSHSTKAKRQHRSLSQDWTMLQSSSAPTPYTPRHFPLSDADWERMQSENREQSEENTNSTTAAAAAATESDDKADSSLQETAVFTDEKDGEVESHPATENNKRTNESTGRHGRAKQQKLSSNPARTGGTPQGGTPDNGPVSDNRSGVKKPPEGDLDLGTIQPFELPKIGKQLDEDKLAPRTRSSPVISGGNNATKEAAATLPLARWLDNDKGSDPDLLEELANAEWSTEEDAAHSD